MLLAAEQHYTVPSPYVVTANTGLFLKCVISLNILKFLAPSPPRNVKIGAVTADTIQLSWYEPARANGVILVSHFKLSPLFIYCLFNPSLFIRARICVNV